MIIIGLNSGKENADFSQCKKSGDAAAVARLYTGLATFSYINALPERITEIANDPNTYLIVCDDGGDILATALLILCNDVMFTRQPFA